MSLLLIFILTILSSFFFIEVLISLENRDGKISKKELIQIACKTLEDKYNLNTENCRIRYDRGNKVWEKYFLKDYPKLKDRDYQAIEFALIGLRIGGGPYWVCIDRVTGEVIIISMGI